MAVKKNTSDLLAQAASTLPDNTTQQISPQDSREMAENIAFSSFNKITDTALVGLKEYSIIPTYEAGQGCINGGSIYISNKVTGPGVFAPADWDILTTITPAQASAITANTAKVTNATHTGEVTGSGALTVQPTLISGKPVKSTLAGTEEILINDGGTFKKVLASNFGGDTIFTGGTMSTPSTITMGGNDLTFDGGKTTFKGSGSTSATTALLVQNSLGINAISALDDNSVTFGNGTTRSGNTYTKFTAIGRNGQSSVTDAQMTFRNFIFENSNGSALSVVSNAGKSCSIELYSGAAADRTLILNDGSKLDFYMYDNYYSSYHKSNGWYFGVFSQNAVSNGAFTDGYGFVIGQDAQLFVGDRTSGVGTTNQGKKLSLRASGYDGTTHTNEIKFQNVTDASGNYKLEIQDTANTPLLSLLGNSGNLGLGVTPTAKLHVNGSTRFDGAISVNGNAGFTGTGAYTNFTIENGIITAAS